MGTRGLSFPLALLLAAQSILSYAGANFDPSKGPAGKPAGSVPAGIEVPADQLDLTKTLTIDTGQAAAGLQLTGGLGVGEMLPGQDLHGALTQTAASTDPGLLPAAVQAGLGIHANDAGVVASAEGSEPGAVAPNLPPADGPKVGATGAGPVAGSSLVLLPSANPVGPASSVHRSRMPFSRRIQELISDLNLTPDKIDSVWEGDRWAVAAADWLSRDLKASAGKAWRYGKGEQAEEDLRHLLPGFFGFVKKIGQDRFHGNVDHGYVPRLDASEPVVARARRPRPLIYPLGADPLHYGHLYSALNGAADRTSDKVLLVFQGSSPLFKPDMTPAEIRKLTTDAGIAGFGDLLMDTGISNTLPGEKNTEGIITLEDLDATYMGGIDHGKLYTGKGTPDTQLQLIEVRKKGSGSLELALIERHGHDIIEKSEMKVYRLSEVPIPISSSDIKKYGLFYLTPFASLRVGLRLARDIYRRRGQDLWNLHMHGIWKD